MQEDKTKQIKLTTDCTAKQAERWKQTLQEAWALIEKAAEEAVEHVLLCIKDDWWTIHEVDNNHYRLESFNGCYIDFPEELFLEMKRLLKITNNREERNQC